MKKIIFQMSISLDGYFEGPDHNLDWHIVDDDFNTYAVETLRSSDVLIMGRTTYELMAGYWPTVTDDDPVAKELNGRPKLVFSRSLKTVDWNNSRLASGSIADEVAHLKKIPGDGLLWVGGSELAAAFLDQGFMDEVRFIMTPVLLGAGNPVFGDIKKRHELNLLWTKRFASGNVVLAYAPTPR
ncbi:MAG TPA: dihydrofolate reductase family protein [Candidatus Eremiobacteraceae bacterium]